MKQQEEDEGTSTYQEKDGQDGPQLYLAALDLVC